VDVEDQIILQLQSDRMTDHYNEWMEELRSKAYVEIKL
jgi:hypothetical protein